VETGYMTDRCINCGRFSREPICDRCMEKDKHNKKLQKLIKESVRVR